MKNKKKRSSAEKIIKIQALLEEHGRFGCDYGPPPAAWKMPDETYKYRQRGIHKFIMLSILTFGSIFAPLLLKIAHGAKVTGKQHMKALKGKGAICVCNHIGILDTLYVRHAMGYFRSYHTEAPFNNRGGFPGFIIRHGAMLPFSANVSAMKNFNAEVERLLDAGKIVNFYPEGAMWNSYQKPRPMKPGAFHYAVKYDVPVVPIFCTFDRTKKCKMKKMRINILPPVYPDESLSKRSRIEDMKARAEKEWKECYETAYGIPLEQKAD